MGMSSDLVERCKARGLAVVELPGWQSRGEGGSFSIRGVILHHDGEGLGNENVPRYMCQEGVNGSQLWIRKTGAVYFLAAGLKWHAGSGGGWRSVPANQGNATCVGIETDHTFGQEWPAPQMAAIVIVTQELCSLYGIDPDQWCCGHREYAPNRKPDPENFDLDAWRSTVKSGGGVVIQPVIDDAPPSWIESFLHWSRA